MIGVGRRAFLFLREDRRVFFYNLPPCLSGVAENLKQITENL